MNKRHLIAAFAGLASVAGLLAVASPQTASAASLLPLATVTGPQSPIVNVDLNDR